MVTAWVQDSGMHLYPNTDIGGKYNVLANGELYINNAGPADAFKTYTCRTVNRLTGKWSISMKPKFSAENSPQKWWKSITIFGKKNNLFVLLSHRSCL